MRRPIAAALACVLLATPAVAQEDATGLEPEAPGIPLSTGFTPDPVRLDGETAGAVPLSGRAPGCRGYVGDAPDQVLRLESRFGFLRTFVTSQGEVTLAVRSPSGRWHCAGRPLGGAPREEGAFEPGIHEVWIGSVRPNERVAYTLHVTEFRTVAPQQGRTGRAVLDGAGVDIGLAVAATEGRFRGRRLRPGFLPDPRQDGGFAGGELSASLLGAGCRGEVHREPGHLLELGGPRTIDGEVVIERFGYFRVHVREAEGPVTLVVRTPSGGYLCSSPDEGLPSIEQDAWPEGTYRVWVGSRVAGARPRYRIEYTETRAAED